MPPWHAKNAAHTQRTKATALIELDLGRGAAFRLEFDVVVFAVVSVLIVIFGSYLRLLGESPVDLCPGQRIQTITNPRARDESACHNTSHIATQPETRPCLLSTTIIPQVWPFDGVEIKALTQFRPRSNYHPLNRSKTHRKINS